ncbi:MAG: hypothetical protein JW943_04705 [Deltaproteobacteria bacterium]|nr:hypothetical protein [Deltaproteobacteria bacterium]
MADSQVEKTELYGIKQIMDCCNNLELPHSESSVMTMINFEGLPARKIGGIWISDSNKIAEWRLKYIDDVKTAEPQDLTSDSQRLENIERMLSDIHLHLIASKGKRG